MYGIYKQETTNTNKMNLDTDLTSSAQMNSKWIIDLKGKCRSVKLLEWNKEKNVCDFGLDNEFLSKTLKPCSMK